MTTCGRCRGRGYIQRIRGVGHDDCPVCKGTGVKVQKASLGSRTVSVPLWGAMCKVCGDAAAVHAHHVVSQSRLKRYLPSNEAREAQADIRNTVPLCFDCHQKVELGRLELAPHELHPGFVRFVEKWDLHPALPRHLTCGAAVDSNPGTVGSSTLRPSREAFGTSSHPEETK